MTTKIHVAVDRSGRPLVLQLSAGQRADITHAEDLLYATIGRATVRRATVRRGDQGPLPTFVIADKAYDADAFIDLLNGSGITAVIPSRSNRRQQREIDTERYRHRNHVERFFNRIKQCRRVATRYEKTARNFLAFILIAAIFFFI